MNRSLPCILTLICAASFMTACRSNTAGTQADQDGYRTIPAPLGRETDLARQLTVEAAAVLRAGDPEQAAVEADDGAVEHFVFDDVLDG